MQSYRRAVNPMVLRRFSRRPQKIGKRYTGRVRTASSVQTKVNLPHDRLNIRDLLGRRLPSSPRGAMDRA